MAQLDLKPLLQPRRDTTLVDGENLLKLNLKYDEDHRKNSKKALQVDHMWKHDRLRDKAIKYWHCGNTFRAYKCSDCGRETVIHTNSCNMRICERCCKKQYWRIRNRLWDILEPYQWIPKGRYKKFMLREITLTWKEDVQDLDQDTLIKERRSQINRLVNQYKRKGIIIGTIKVFETKRSTKDLTRIHIHAHLLTISSYISQVDMSKRWEKITGSPVVWIQLRQIDQALNYLLKHIYKPPEILPSDVPLFLKLFRNRRRITTDGILFGIKFWKNLTCDMAITCAYCGQDLGNFEVKSLFRISREFLNGIG